MEIDNLIIIKNGIDSGAKEALISWIAEHFENVKIDCVFELYKCDKERYVIKVDQRIGNKKFYELIQYLFRLKKINSKIEIEGFTTGKGDNQLRNKKLLVYISPNDFDDSVSAVSSQNKNYRIYFYENIIKEKIAENKQYEYPDNIKLEYPEIIKSAQILQLKKEKSDKNSTIRFFIILPIAILLFAWGLPLETYDTKMFTDWISYFGAGLGIWYYVDYKILRIDKLYYLSLLISIIYLVVGLNLIEKNVSNYTTEHGFLFYPLVLLLIQKPARKIYLLIMKKEPEVSRIGPVSVIIYSVSLLLIPLAFVFLITFIIV